MNEVKKVNVLELASELAHIKLIENHSLDIKIYVGEEDDKCTTYTEEAQDIFNRYYDYYLEIIDECTI